jgi:hypothetical protein
MLVVPEAAAKQIALGYAKGVGDALDKQLDPEVPETMRNVEGLPVVRGERRTRAVVIPANGMLPYTAEAQAEMKRGNGMGGLDNIEERPNWERCVRSLGQPPVFPIGSGNPREFIQRPDQIIVHTEYGDEARIIPFTDKHKPKMFWSLLGDSIARWEGNTLVIETVNFTDKTSIGLNGNGLRHSASMKLVERFTRVEPDVIRYEATIEDPKTYTRPWRISLPLTSPPGFQLLPYECHEGNYMLPAVLSAERTEDKAIEEDAKKGIIRARKGIQQNLNAAGIPIPGTQGGEGGPPR